MAVNKRKILESAQKHLQKGALDKALKDYTTLLQADPRDANSRLKVGDIQLRRGNRDEAIQAYLKVAEQFMEDGFDAKAVAIYKQVVKIDPKRHEVYHPLAELYQRLGLISEAMSALQSAAEACQRDGREKEALELLRKTATLDPTNTLSRLKIAELLCQAELYDDAFAEFEEIAAELGKQGETDRMLSTYERVLEIDADRVSTLTALAHVRLELDAPDQAIELAQRVRELQPEEPSAHELLIEILRGAGREPEREEAERRLADIFSNRGDEDRAREMYQRLTPQAIGEVTDDPEAPVIAAAADVDGLGFEPDQLVAEARVYLKFGKHDRASQTLETVLGHDPDHLPALELLGEVFADRRAVPKARDAWERGVLVARERGDEESERRLVERMEALASEAPLTDTLHAEPEAGVAEQAAPPADAVPDAEEEDVILPQADVPDIVPVEDTPPEIEIAAEPAGEALDLEGAAETPAIESEPEPEAAPTLEEPELPELEIEFSGSEEDASVPDVPAPVEEPELELAAGSGDVEIEIGFDEAEAPELELDAPTLSEPDAPLALDTDASPEIELETGSGDAVPDSEVDAETIDFNAETEAAVPDGPELPETTAAPAADDPELDLGVSLDLPAEPELSLTPGEADAEDEQAAADAEASATLALEGGEQETPEVELAAEVPPAAVAAPPEEELVGDFQFVTDPEETSADVADAADERIAVAAESAAEAPALDDDEAGVEAAAETPSVSGAPEDESDWSESADAEVSLDTPSEDEGQPEESLFADSLDTALAQEDEAEGESDSQEVGAPDEALLAGSESDADADSDLGSGGYEITLDEVTFDPVNAGADAAGRTFDGASSTTPQQISEDLEEAEFYLAQRLIDEAEAIFRRVLEAAPNHPQALLRLGEIAELRGEAPDVPEAPAVSGVPEPDDETQISAPDDMGLSQPMDALDEFSDEDDSLDLQSGAEAEPEVAPQAEAESDDVSQDTDPAELSGVEDASEQAAALQADAADDGTVDLAAELSDVIEEVERLDDSTPPPVSLDEGFDSIFAEFKEGVSEQLDEDDTETRYDLGIAYKEMGLVEDALGEFQQAARSEERRRDCLHMMGMCAMELGRADDAVAHFQQALSEPDVPAAQETALRFDLACAFEAAGDMEHAREAFEQVRARDASFRDVAERLRFLGTDATAEDEPDAETSGDGEVFESFDDLLAEARGEDGDDAGDTGGASDDDTQGVVDLDESDVDGSGRARRRGRKRRKISYE